MLPVWQPSNVKLILLHLRRFSRSLSYIRDGRVGFGKKHFQRSNRKLSPKRTNTQEQLCANSFPSEKVSQPNDQSRELVIFVESFQKENVVSQLENLKAPMKVDMCKICMNSVAQFRTWHAQKQLNLKFTSSAEPSLRARMSFLDCLKKCQKLTH